MRQKLFLLVMSMVASVAAMAQTWEAPAIDESKFVSDFKTTTLGTDEVEGDTTLYYLYNVGAKGFLNAGTAPTHSAWSTNCVVSGSGLQIMVVKYELSELPQDADKEKVGTSEPAEWDGKSYVIYDNYGGKWRGVIITSATGTFVDRASQIDYKWEITRSPQGGSTYRIKTADVNPNYNNAGLSLAESYFGWDEMDDDYLNSGIKPVTPAIDMSNVDAVPHVDWAFVTEEAYQNFLARTDLYNQLNTAAEEGVDYAAALAVYNNTAATTEQVKAAYKELRQAVIDKQFAGASDEKPLDVTSFIVNPDFSTGNTNGWTNTFVKEVNATNCGYQSHTYTNGEVSFTTFIEAWAKSGTKFNTNYEEIGASAIGVAQLSQTLDGMPQGKFKFTCDAISVQQYLTSLNPVKGVELFATGGDVDIYQNIATGNGLPEHFEVYFVNAGEAVTLGLRTTEDCTANWIGASNFTLTYYGPVEGDPYKVILDLTTEQVLEEYPLDEVNGLVASASAKEAYRNAVATAQSATADYQAVRAALLDAKKALTDAIDAYANFQTKYDGWLANFEEYDNLFSGDNVSAEWGDFSDFIQSTDESPEGYPSPAPAAVLKNQPLSVEELATYIEQVDELYATAFGASLQPGMDCSSLLVNASFADGFDGWVNNSGSGTLGGLKDYPCVERYGGKVDVYQTVKVPSGVYSLTCQAFERPGEIADVTGDEESKVYLYMNDNQTPVQNILADAMPEDKAEDKVNCFISGGTPDEDYYSTSGTTNADSQVTIDGVLNYVPNGMSGASYAFRSGRYEQTVYGLVEDGTMKIGLTSNDVAAHWVLWAKFKLVYMGSGADATKIMLETYYQSLQSYIDNNGEENMTSVAVTAAENTIAAAKAAVTENNAEKMTAAINEVQSGLDAAKANVAAVKSFNAAEAKLTDALNGEDPNPKGLDAYDEIKSQMEGYKDLTTDELTALIAKMDEVAALLNTPLFDGASDSNPVDCTKMIENNSFETGDFSGWTYNTNATGDTRIADNTNATYTIDNADGAYVFNTWSGDAVDGGYWVKQTIAGLPAGTYELQALLASDENNVISLGANGGAVAFTMTGEKNVAVDASIIFGVETAGDVEITAFSETWFKADNFRLTYYGTESAKELTGIEGVKTAATAKANGKYLENGRIVIIKNGKKYNVAGQAIK